MAEAAALALLCRRDSPGKLTELRKAAPSAVPIVASFLHTAHTRLVSLIGRRVRFRVDWVPHPGRAVEVDLLDGTVTVLLDNGQVVRVDRGSDDLSDTAVLEAEDSEPHVLRQVTPEWLTSVLGGPKYQPRVHTIERHLVPENAVCRKSCKQRLHYFADNETKLRLAGRPKFAFVKLCPVLSKRTLHETGSAKREAFLYQDVLHSFQQQVAPLSMHVGACGDDHGSPTLILQDMATWRPVDPKGADEADAAAIAATLAHLHSRYWSKPSGLLRLFASEDSGRVAVLNRIRGVSELLSAAVARLRSDHPSDELVGDLGAVEAALAGLCGRAEEVARECTSGGKKCLCHLDVRPAHVFVCPQQQAPSKSVFVDWSCADAAPPTLDLAFAVGQCLAEGVPASALVEAYAAALSDNDVGDAPGADELAAAVRKGLPVVVLCAVAALGKHLAAPLVGATQTQEKAWEEHAAALSERLLHVLKRPEVREAVLR
eukprot:TRINITY_DN14351_c0_g1_i1.p1 TRINITY_DN14351_c0_g1~~TRINITY_DN14351_c0_g1_i1.p1  ORF type:complete len:507 (+),score=123.33 TRINITY_DN14351_c0_g1_i1:63-1523(+)